MLAAHPLENKQANPGPIEFQLKATRQPLFWAAVSYGAGIVYGADAWRPAPWWTAAAMAFLAAGFYFTQKRSWLAAILSITSFALIGALHIQLCGPRSALDTSLLSFADYPQVEITAHVTRDGQVRPGDVGEARETADVETEEIISNDDRRFPMRAGITTSPSIFRRTIRLASSSSAAGSSLDVASTTE